MNNWYDTDKSEWYLPLYYNALPSGSQAPAAKAQEPQKKSKKAVWRTVGIILLAVALIASGAYVIRDRLPKLLGSFSFSYSSSDGEGFKIGDGDSVLPFFGDSEDTEESEPADKDEFFSTYYTVTDNETEPVNIERAALPFDFAVELAAPEGDTLTLQELYSSCMQSVVGITGYVDGLSGYYWGTGIILTEDGLILTNTHVVEGCDSAVVTLYNDEEYDALLVGSDATSDLAVLKIDAKGLVPAEFGDSSLVNVGDPVAAIGNPLGESFRMTMTDGIISAINRDITYNGRSMTLLQTNTALNEGNSGGPLYNMYGQVVGVTNMKMMSSYSSIEAIGFAIPSSTVKKIVDNLVVNGEVRGRPSIGITVGAIPDYAKETYNLPDGLYISAVSEGSDAEAKGLLTGDIVTAVNGIPVTTIDEISDIKDQYYVGDTMTFSIWRELSDGTHEEFTVDIVLMDTNDIYG